MAKDLVQNLEVRGAPAQLFHWAYSGEFPPEVVVWGPAGTGKSMGIIALLCDLCESHPGTRIMALRLSRESLTESFCETIENILPPGHPALAGPDRAHRHAYLWPNGSRIVLGGLDRGTKHFSSEYDVIYVMEIREITQRHFEELHRALRPRRSSQFGKGLPFQTLIGDTNPTFPSHWLKKRMNAGGIPHLRSFHEDNPAWYDIERGEWTEAGRKYLERMSKRTGVVRKWLFEGEWAAAEGLVWDNWNPDVHMVDLPMRGGLIDLRALKIEWVVAGMDFGTTAPGVLQVWGFAPIPGDQKPRGYRLMEVYRTRESIPWWAERVLEAHREFDLRAVTADAHNELALREINRLVSRSGVFLRPTEAKRRSDLSGGDIVGLDLVRQCLEPAEDGKPYLLFGKNTLRYKDERLESLGLPVGFEEEVNQFVYAKARSGDEDVGEERTDPRCRDDAADTLRYVCELVYGERRTFGERPQPRFEGKFPQGSWGDLLGHGEVYAQIARERAEIPLDDWYW